MRSRFWTGLLGLLVFAGSQPLLAAEPRSATEIADALETWRCTSGKGRLRWSHSRLYGSDSSRPEKCSGVLQSGSD